MLGRQEAGCGPSDLLGKGWLLSLAPSVGVIALREVRAARSLSQAPVCLGGRGSLPGHRMERETGRWMCQDTGDGRPEWPGGLRM